jgi:uncharacterized repeat protein (TIGR01451 family)
VRTATLAATFTGDPAQVCFRTTVGPSSCNVDQSITNSANAVTIGTNGVSDAPAGNSTGAATFLEAATPKTSRCKADLSIDKSAGVDFISPGGQVTYTLVVENHGPDTATSAKVSDDVPAGLTITSLQPNQGTCSTSAGEIKCQLGTIANGGMVQILVMADASSSIQVGSTVKNCASTTAFQTDPVASNNSSCVSKPVKPEPPGAVDIQVSKHVDTRVAKFGKPVTYTLDVRNNGPDRAPDARVTDTSGLPLRILSAKSSQGTCGSRQPLACDLGPLASGETATITVKAIPKQTGPTVNTVSTTPGCNDSGCATDTDPRNNVSSARVTVKPYITLVKSVSTHVVKAGHELTYRLTVANPTPVNVPNVRVCDTLPAGIVFVRSTPSGTLSNGRHCWPLGTLGGNRSRGITIVGRAASGASGRIVNHATATGTGVDPAHAKAGVRVIAKPPVPTPVTG